MSKYDDALASIPAPGTGCHPALLSVASLGVLSGRSESQIMSDIRANIPRGNRKVQDKEILEAIAKAKKTAVPYAADGDGTQPFIDLDSPLPLRIIRPEYLSPESISEPEEWDKVDQIRRYVQAMYRPGEYIAYTLNAYQTTNDDGSIKYSPTKGVTVSYDDFMRESGKKDFDFDFFFGSPSEDFGGWIRINPVVANGYKDTDVTAYRHALVESDKLNKEKQLAIIRKLELPCDAIVSSGGKSVHALVRVDALNEKDYQRRVDYLISVCEQNGLEIDKANRNPSRYSRFPGVVRNGSKQFLIDVHCGKQSWQDWVDFVEESNDDLPDIIEEDIISPPAKKPEIIQGVLRLGNKMLLSGASKAGKSFALMELASAIARGGEWFGWQCTKGKALYINLELDREECLDRFYNINRIKGAFRPAVWNLRGKAQPLDKLAPKIIRRCKTKGYTCIIIDPIYKVISGDENNATEVSHFCNILDEITTQLNVAVVYCHHHSKGEQGQKKAQDRASGSGVFARDVDALLDLIEVQIKDDVRDKIKDKWIIDEIHDSLDRNCPYWKDYIPVSQQNDLKAIMNSYQLNIPDIREITERNQSAAEYTSAWRVSGILRCFPTFRDRYILFKYPCHYLDTENWLNGALAAGEMPVTPIKKSSEILSVSDTILTYDEIMSRAGSVSMKDMQDALHISRQATMKRLRNAGYVIKDSKIVKEHK